jgi:SAM-dependent methyltransferase
MNKEKVGSFYDVVWTEYVPELEASEKHWRLFYSPQEVRGKSVLDAGCGTGIFSVIFARNGAGQVTGIDISPGSLETAKSLKAKFGVDNAEFRLQDMLRLPFADGSLFLAVYKRTKVTFIHEIIRKTLIRTPRTTWTALSKIMAFFLSPAVFFFKKREKSRKGEKLEELILDWYFVPIRHYYTPEEIRRLLNEKGLDVEKFLPASGRFDSSSNFIFKARKGLQRREEAEA